MISCNFTRHGDRFLVPDFPVRHVRLAIWILASAAVSSGPAAASDAFDSGGSGASYQHVVHAQSSLRQGHFSEAIAYSNRALAAYPNYMSARFVRGRSEMAAGENEQAIADFTAVIASHPEYPRVYRQRGEAYLRARKPTPAIADFDLALNARVAPNSYEAAEILAQRSLALELAGQQEAAFADLQAALKMLGRDEGDWRVLNDHCYTAAIVGLLDIATITCDEAISRHSRDLGSYDSRGLLELKGGLWAKAVADYTQAIYYRPELATALYGRAIARRAIGDKDGGKSDLAAALKSEPDITAIMTRLGVTAPK